MQIAVCDDEKADAEILMSHLSKCIPHVSCAVFTCAEDLIEHIHLRKVFFDLIFLDIEMETLDGYTAAKYLVAQSNPHPLIIFATKSSLYSVRGYGIAFRYLVKPITYNMVVTAISHAFRLLLPSKFQISCHGEHIYVPLPDIFYFEVRGTHSTLHAKDLKAAFRMTLKTIEQRLPPLMFSRPHNSYLINLSKVRKISHNQLLLTNNAIIPLSRSRKKAFYSDLQKHLQGI